MGKGACRIEEKTYVEINEHIVVIRGSYCRDKEAA